MSMRGRQSTVRLRALAWLLAASAVAPGLEAQQFHLYLDCKGSLRTATGKSEPAQLSLALRDNNTTALIQRSNLLPVGERMRYTATQTHYAMVYATPRPGTTVYMNWFGSILFVTYPEFRRVVETRLSVDRQSADLEGEMMALNNELLGTLRMSCVAQKHDEAPAPRI